MTTLAASAGQGARESNALHTMQIAPFTRTERFLPLVLVRATSAIRSCPTQPLRGRSACRTGRPFAVHFDTSFAVVVKAVTRVAVTAQIDRVNAALRFGPHGTLFPDRTPAKVSLNYFGLDLAGRRPEQLTIWYQPDDMTAWDPQSTRLDVQLWWLGANISHFSNYADSY